MAICISLERKSRVRKKPRLQSPLSPLNSKASSDNKKVLKDYMKNHKNIVFDFLDALASDF